MGMINNKTNQPLRLRSLSRLLPNITVLKVPEIIGVVEDVRMADLAGEVLLESNGPDEEGMLVLYSTKYFKAQVDRNQAWDEMVRDAAPYAPKFCGPLLILTTCEGHIPERCAELVVPISWMVTLPPVTVSSLPTPT